MARMWQGEEEMTAADAEEFMEGVRGTYVNTMGAKEESVVKLLYLTAQQATPQAYMLKALKAARTTVVLHGFRRSMGPDDYDKAHSVKMQAMEPAAAVQEASGWIGYVGMEGERMRRETPTECLVIPPGAPPHAATDTPMHAKVRTRTRGHVRVRAHIHGRVCMHGQAQVSVHMHARTSSAPAA